MSLPEVYYELLALASKYNINSVAYSVATVNTMYGQSSLAILCIRLHV